MRTLRTNRVQILRFRDGDTLEALVFCGSCSHGHVEVIRLSDVESYEPVGPDSSRALAIASELTARFKNVEGDFVGNLKRRDKYGRLIGDVIIERELLTAKLVTIGASWYGVGTLAPSSFTGTIDKIET